MPRSPYRREPRLTAQVGVRRQRIGLFLAFAGLGATGAVVPASVPALAELMATDPAALVRVIPALFIGLFAGVALSPVASRRLSTPAGAAGGAALQAAALALLAGATSTPAAIAAAATAGVGFGLVESCGAALARLLTTSHTGSTLTQLTAVTAAVATLTPLTVLAGGTTAVRLVLAATTAPHLLAAVALSGRSSNPRHEAAAAAGQRAPRRWIAVALFCYVGSETVVAGWSAVLPQQQLQLSATDAALGTSLFWLLLTLGRLAGAALLARGTDPQTVLLACQATCVALLLSSTFASGAPVTALALLGAAVAVMGPCYALILGGALQSVDAHEAARLSAVLVGVGALGGATWSAAATGQDLNSRAIVATAFLAITISAVCAHRARAVSKSSD